MVEGSTSREEILPNDMPPMTGRTWTAGEQDEFTRRWPELNDDDWAHLPIVRPGERLEADETYFDLNRPDRGAISGSNAGEATEENRYVTKSKLDPAIWDIFVSGQQVSDLSRRLENEYPANEQPGGDRQP
jgi:hypothetical protein